MGRVLEEAIQEIVVWVVEGFVYNEGRVMGMEDIWGTRLVTSEQGRVKAMEEWEKNMMKFNRKNMTKKAMKEWMGRRSRGILPKVEVCRAPGVGGVFWYYEQEERDDEDDEESDCLEENAAAHSLIGSIALNGTAPMKLTNNEIKTIEKVGRKILQESSAQIAEELYEIGINRDSSTWKLGLINRGRWEEGDFESRLYDFMEDTEIWLEVEHINEEERTERTNQGF